jgi:hypothetical protein
MHRPGDFRESARDGPAPIADTGHVALRRASGTPRANGVGVCSIVAIDHSHRN